MSLKLPAQEVYRLEREVEDWRRKIAQAAPAERDRLEKEIVQESRQGGTPQGLCPYPVESMVPPA